MFNVIVKEIRTRKYTMESYNLQCTDSAKMGNGECKALVISFEILIKHRINFTPESDLGVVCFSNFLLKVTSFQISDYLFFLLLVNLLLIS